MDQIENSAELYQFNPIRVETVLSRFPVHRLAKRGKIEIEISEKDELGEEKTSWEVTYNSKYGQPGALAYKVDTLIVNRRIDECPRPVPEVIRLGSLKELGNELGLWDSGKNRSDIKRALNQNAGATINAKKSYKGADGVERTIEISDTRYGVIFTGKRFPDGGKADAVYLILHRAYREMINTAPLRPLDYDYLKDLAPGPQRLYELLSYQIFAALKNNRPRAKLLYSYFCARAPMTRYFDYDHVKKQMYKLHVPHKKSGYISDVEIREVRDDEGHPDWEMLYTPGRRAKAEFRELKSSRRGLEAMLPEREAFNVARPVLALAGGTASDKQTDTEIEALVAELVGHKVSEKKARELVASKPETVRLQLRAIPYLPESQGKRNFAGRLVAAIENDYALPQPLIEAIERERREKTSKASASKVAACPYCREFNGLWYPHGFGGPVRRCTHDPEIEESVKGKASTSKRKQ
jgi:hypothetical protein